MKNVKNITVDGKKKVATDLDVGAGDNIRFDVCRENGKTNFRVEVGSDVVVPKFSDPTTSPQTACQNGCNVTISDSGYDKPTLYVKPGHTVTFVSNVTAPVGNLTLVILENQNDCNSTLQTGVTFETDEVYNYVVPRRFAGKTLYFSFEPFCGVPYFTGEIIVGNVTSNTFTLLFPTYVISKTI